MASLLLTAPNPDRYDWCSARWYISTASWSFPRTSGKQDSGLMMISQNHNKLSEKVWAWISRVSKPKGTSLTFEARFCSTTATTKTTHVWREKQTESQQLHECSCHKWAILWYDICMWIADLLQGFTYVRQVVYICVWWLPCRHVDYNSGIWYLVSC